MCSLIIYLDVLIEIFYRFQYSCHDGIIVQGICRLFYGFLDRSFDILRNQIIRGLSDIIEDVINSVEIEFEGSVCVELVVESLERRILEFGGQIEIIEDRNIPCSLSYLLYLAFHSFLSYQTYSSFDDTEDLSYEFCYIEDAVDFRQDLRDFRRRRQDRQCHLDARNE